jgi:trigger factor
VFEIEKEYLDSHEVRLDVTFEDSVVQQAMRNVAREVSRKINIPGFRKGRAPYGKIVRHVGESAILQEAAEDLLENNYAQFLEDADVKPYGPGEFENMETDPLTFTLRVPLQPTVTLGDYQSIRKEWDEPEVSDEEMAQVLEQVREEHAVLDPVERPAEMGDQIYGNVLGTVEGDVVVDEEDVEIALSETAPFLSEEFVAALVSASAGETVAFSATLPETIQDPALQGAECDFEVEVTQVYNRDLPELDDALASTVGSFETIEDLREDIYTRIQESKLNQTRQAYRDAIVEDLVAMSEIEYPPVALEDTLDEMVEETERQVRRNQQMALEDALRLQGQTLEMFRSSLEPQAEERLKRSFVLAEFANAEGIEVTEDEVVQEYSAMMTSAGMNEADLETIPLNSQIGQSLRNGILGRKTLERLEAVARGEADAEPPADEPEGQAEDVEAEADADTEADADNEVAADNEVGAESDVQPEPEVEGDGDETAETETEDAPAAADEDAEATAEPEADTENEADE